MISNKSKFTRVIYGLLALFLLLSAAVACTPQSDKQSGGKDGLSTPAATEGNPAAMIDLPVYYVKITENEACIVREVHQVPYTEEVIKAALEELINSAPVTTGSSRVLPAETKIRAVSVKDGLTTVDFSRDVLNANLGAFNEELGIQSIVNTVTEVSGVQKVSFLVEGTLDQESKNWWGHVGLYEQPFTRDITRVDSPAIWVTNPAPGQKVTFPLEVQGSARVFEGTVNARLLDDSGKELASGFTTATSGAPERGDFNLSLSYQPNSTGTGKLEVYWESPKDGAATDVVEIPVSW